MPFDPKAMFAQLVKELPDTVQGMCATYSLALLLIPPFLPIRKYTHILAHSTPHTSRTLPPTNMNAPLPVLH